MSQRYVINENVINDFNVERLKKDTLEYSHTQLLEYLKNNFGASYSLVATQLELYEKVKNKLPLWSLNNCLVTRKGLEQSSSWSLALYKASLIKAKLLVDLSGGLGVDDVAFSKSASKVISIDPDTELNTLVRYNFNQLLIQNIDRFDEKAEAFIKEFDLETDVFFIDADRRSKGNKIFTLEDSVPNVISLMPELLRKAPVVMLKLSPMVDLKLLMKTFKTIKEVIVVGLRNEVKEILAVVIADECEPEIKAVEVNDEGTVVHELSSRISQVSATLEKGSAKYFYEPSNMVIKAGLSAVYASVLKYSLINKNSHYMLSDLITDKFFGRSFIIVHQAVFSKSSVKKYLSNNGINKANVSARNFVTTVDEIRKTFKLNDGGDDYLFFTQDTAKNKLFYHCRKF